MFTSKLPDKALSFMGTKRWTNEVAQEFSPLEGLWSLSRNDKDAITLFFTTSSSGSQRSSFNTPHITLSEGPSRGRI